MIKEKNYNTDNFFSDLKKAKAVEQEIAERLRVKGYDVKLAPDKFFPDYDMIVRKDNKIQRVEIKVDYMSKKTGNACIEYAKINGKPSGCTVGKVDDVMMFIFREFNPDDDFYILVKRIDIYTFAKNNHHRIVTSYEGNTLNYLVKKDILLKQFKPNKLSSL